MTEITTQQVQAETKNCPKQKLVVIIAYVLMLLTLFTGISSVIALIVAYVQRESAKGSIYEAHYVNIIKTFWIALGLTILGVFTVPFLIGYFILLATTLFYIFKVTKGLLRIHYDLEV